MLKTMTKTAPQGQSRGKPKDAFWSTRMKQVCVDPRPSDHSMTLAAHAARSGAGGKYRYIYAAGESSCRGKRSVGKKSSRGKHLVGETSRRGNVQLQFA